MLVAGGAASTTSTPVGVHASRFTDGINASSIGLKYGSGGTNGKGGDILTSVSYSTHVIGNIRKAPCSARLLSSRRY